MIAVCTFWRFTKNSYPYQFMCNVAGCPICDGSGRDRDGFKHILSDSELETIRPGDRCDWAAGSVYESLGYCVPCDSA